MLFFDKSEEKTFFYGNTCKVSDRAPQVQSSLYYKDPISIQKGLWNQTNELSHIPKDASSEATVVSTFKSTSEVQLNRLPSRMKTARETMGLKQQEAASLIGVSISTLQKTESGEIRSPSRENSLKYMDFLALEKILIKNLDQLFLRRTILTIPSILYDNLSALKYAESLFPNGMQPVLASFRKSYE